MWKQLIPDGVSELDSRAFLLKAEMIEGLKRLYQQYGYCQVQTPTFEYYDLFAKIQGTLHPDRMVKLIDQNGKILVLRPDATIPIARMAAANGKKYGTYFKYSYITDIFRLNDQQKQSLQQREFTQGGVELFGRGDVEADVEIITLAMETLRSAGFEEFTIDLGQANYFKALIEQAEWKEGELDGVKRSIEEKNFAELQHRLHLLELEEDAKKVIGQLPFLYGEPKQVIAEAEALALNAEMRKAIGQIEAVYIRLEKMGFAPYLSVDLGLINHCDYYTGVIFQGFLPNYGKPVILGGRYDQLTAQFGHAMPATGFGVNIDKLLEASALNGATSSFKMPPTLYLLFNEEKRQEGMELAQSLRGADYIVETDLGEERRSLYEQRLAVLPNTFLLQLGEGIRVKSRAAGERYFTNTGELLQYVNELKGG